ncbi:MAG: 1-acyl-sn-glycerol-3-phosphate acyltransferase [Rhodospirillales bacterium]|nr:1-acyl-sn-glycerol-3-phosphate acyltransferase [Rhodospirillales bacterium]
MSKPSFGLRTRGHALPPGADPFGALGPGPIDESFGRAALAAVRALAIVVWSGLCIPLQALFLALPGRAKAVFPRIYWRGMCFCVGLSLRDVRLATPATTDRPVVYIANHSSWLDILVLGALLPGCFVAKGEVGTWPVIGLIARLGRSVFVERRRTSTGRERDLMRERLAAGDNLILFPEGTSSDGTRVLAFRPTFFAVAVPFAPDPGDADRGDPDRGDPDRGAPVAPVICPIAVAYDRVGFLPAGRTSRPLFAWYGDMDLLPHAWRLLRQRGVRASVLHAAPIDPADFADRKALAAAAWHVVAHGAATLRQNREPETIPAGPAADAAYA